MDKLQAMAEAFAASIPPHLGQPTIPPIKWRQEGEIVHVVLADGRMFEASIQEINHLMFEQMIEPEVKTLNKALHPDLDNLEVDLHQKMVKPAASARKRKANVPNKGKVPHSGKK
jgi:hypothetical protein